ncbi:PIF-2 [Plodia interpunctella granulovirus]|uniref:PIF-2 n=1 Tax=Plodia interpunctella granulovirus TaxID=262175 RepID=A0A1L5JGL9_9BBAC|nr:PIF-2 [Plodia interpunctella granulovirus]APO13925.1 PIF-2 [Plodia interpunctella granulovirus]
MFWLIVTLFVLFLYILYLPLKTTYDVMYTEMLERNALVNDDEFREAMKNRRYTPLHALPAVRWHYNFDTLEGSSSCFSVPTLVTVTNTGTFDCAAVCNDDRAVYFFVNPNDKFVVNGTLLMSGGYCTMNSVPRNCNSETSLILYSVNQWTCIAEDPRYFAGEGNLVQIAGRQHGDHILPGDADKIVLWDNERNRAVNPVMVSHRYTWDDRMADGKRRFEVRCEALDIRHNLMFNNPHNEIECLPNVCTTVNWIHRDVRPNFDNGTCDCGNFNNTRVRHITDSDPTSMCASIVNRLDFQEGAYEFRVGCLSLDTPITEYHEDKLLCPPDIFNQNTDFAYTFRVEGVVPMSGNGIDEPTTRLWKETRNRINWHRRSAA